MIPQHIDDLSQVTIHNTPLVRICQVVILVDFCSVQLKTDLEPAQGLMTFLLIWGILSIISTGVFLSTWAGDVICYNDRYDQC